MTSALVCPSGEVMDVSREGFRLASPKKFAFKAGEVHQVVLRAGKQQVRASARVQWIKRASLFPARYEAGFQIVDPRAGVGVAVLQMGQFGCVSAESVDAGSPQEAANRSQPAQAGVTASVEIEDLYEILGIDADADADAIKRAYRKLAQQHHPDHSEADDAEAVFDRIAKAYSVLGDVRRRDWYDRMRAGDLVA
ncbi:MAG: J domain-containing protein [Planctomycetota bacterium]